MAEAEAHALKGPVFPLPGYDEPGPWGDPCNGCWLMLLSALAISATDGGPSRTDKGVEGSMKRAVTTGTPAPPAATLLCGPGAERG